MKHLHVSGLAVVWVQYSMLTLTQDIIPATNTFNKQFLDLLRRIFVYDPRARITAKNALKHPWFLETLIDDGTEAARIRREREMAR
jgi:serine/threonine protein kinase